MTARFVAELWPGAVGQDLARGGAVAALLAPVVLCLGKGPLCAIADVQKVDPGSQACSAAASRRIVVTGLLAVSGSGRSLRRACSKSPMPRCSARARRSSVRTRRWLAGDGRTADGRWSGSASLGARCPEPDADPSQAHVNALPRV